MCKKMINFHFSRGNQFNAMKYINIFYALHNIFYYFIVEFNLAAAGDGRADTAVASRCLFFSAVGCTLLFIFSSVLMGLALIVARAHIASASVGPLAADKLYCFALHIKSSSSGRIPNQIFPMVVKPYNNFRILFVHFSFSLLSCARPR